MPFKVDKKKLKFNQDRRRKLSEQDIHRIKRLAGTVSRRQLAKMHSVSPRTIEFILYPERREANVQKRRERGGWRQYYNKEDHRESMKETRRYKNVLNKRGELD